jgi:hypothetical protein
MSADFGESACSVLLAFLVTESGNAVWRKKVDLHHDDGIGILRVE